MQFLDSSDKNAAMDYGSALASAVAWLGNRYLLASPARRLTNIERCMEDPTDGAIAPTRPSQLREPRVQPMEARAAELSTADGASCDEYLDHVMQR